MNSHIKVFHISHFVMGKLQTHFPPNNHNKARTKLSNKTENIFGRNKRNGPKVIVIGPFRFLRTDIFFDFV